MISPNQAAFVQGGSIAESISMVSEGVQLLDKKSHGGNVGFKLDISKANDTI